MARRLDAIAPLPSKQKASAKNGSGGIRLAQTTNARPFTGPWRESDRETRLPAAQQAEAHRLSANAASGNELPLAAPIQHRPAAATAMPASWARSGFSETPRSATLITTKFTPHKTTTSRASAMSRG